jgi:type III restriction enzyme
VPDATGAFSTVLLRRGTEKLREISAAWEEYAKQQNDADPVQPLMVLQVPNSPDHTEIGTWLETVFNTWPELPTDSVYNVFGEHKTETFGAYSAPYIPPERVQESEYVRILVAKDAISTGWDCPRAEVMVSFRAASDKTHITQLLGRMVRTPLARRIPGNQRLNSVDCLLPHFNQKSVQDVFVALTTGGDAGDQLPGRRVLINPQKMNRNPDIPQEVWDKLISLPSQSLPKKQARPVKRLTALAHELAADGLLANAGKIAHAKLHKVLDGARVTYADEIKSERSAILKVEGKTVKANVETKAMTFNDFVEDADYAVIEDAYKRAGRALTPDVTKTYSEYLASQASDEIDPEEALIDAHTSVAALGMVAKVREYLEAEAEKLANEWLTTYRVAIKNLSDERQEVYREIRAMSSDPLDVEVAEPRAQIQSIEARDPDGTVSPLPHFGKHLLCDDAGMFPVSFGSTWEAPVLQAELDRVDNIAWYRNPAHTSPESLGWSMTMERI